MTAGGNRTRAIFKPTGRALKGRPGPHFAHTLMPGSPILPNLPRDLLRIPVAEPGNSIHPHNDSGAIPPPTEEFPPRND